MSYTYLYISASLYLIFLFHSSFTQSWTINYFLSSLSIPGTDLYPLKVYSQMGNTEKKQLKCNVEGLLIRMPCKYTETVLNRIRKKYGEETPYKKLNKGNDIYAEISGS